MKPLSVLLAAALAVAGGMALAADETLIGGNVESLLAFARERHPEFAAMRAEADAATERIAPAGALPDPSLRVELRDFTNEMSGGSPNLLPARVGSTRYLLTQTLPWVGKRDLRREA
ncbi:MAG: TolC family protein, partial [Rhodocyclaceae bacterium]|nr:TolC family protein [Rhodocyclaceae bacterium]